MEGLPDILPYMCLSFQDSRYLATGCYDFLIRIFDLQNPKNPPREIVNGKERVMKVLWSSDGDSILSADHAGILRKWNVHDLSCSKELSILSTEEDKESTVTDLHYVVVDTRMLPIFENTLPLQNKSLLCVTSGHTVTFVDDVSLEIVHTITLSSSSHSVSTHPAYSRYLVVGAGMDIVIYDLYSRKEIFVHKGHHGNIYSLRFSPDGDILVTGADDATVRLWKFSDLVVQHKSNDTKQQSVYTPQANNHPASYSPQHDAAQPQAPVTKPYPVIQNQNARSQVRDAFHGPIDNYVQGREEHYNHPSQSFYSARPQVGVDSRPVTDYPNHHPTTPYPQRQYERTSSYLENGYAHPTNPHPAHGHWQPPEHGNPPYDAHYQRNEYMSARDHYGKATPNHYRAPPVHHSTQSQVHGRPQYPAHPQEYSAPPLSYPHNSAHHHHDYHDYARHPPNHSFPYSAPPYHESASRPPGPHYRGYDMNPNQRSRIGPNDSNDMFPHDYKYPISSYSKPEYSSSVPEHYMPQYSSMESTPYSQYPHPIRGRPTGPASVSIHDSYSSPYSHAGPSASNSYYPPQTDGRLPASNYPGAYQTSAAAVSYR